MSLKITSPTNLDLKTGDKHLQEGCATKYQNGEEKTPVENLTTSEFSVELRFAPREQFFQGKLYRVPIPNNYPYCHPKGNYRCKRDYSTDSTAIKT